MAPVVRPGPATCLVEELPLLEVGQECTECGRGEKYFWSVRVSGIPDCRPAAKFRQLDAGATFVVTVARLVPARGHARVHSSITFLMYVRESSTHSALACNIVNEPTTKRISFGSADVTPPVAVSM